MPIKRDIIYPIFLECCKFTDSYWSQIFEELSYGKCPYGSYINKNFLCCNFKGKEFSYPIDITKTPENIYKEVYQLLHDKLGVSSNKQRLDKIKNMEESDTNWKHKKWNNIKKKNIRDIIIDNYIIEKRQKFNLDASTTFRLKNIIITGILFKTITSKDINYSNGAITDIKGIEFTDGNLILDPSIITFTPVTEKSSRFTSKKRISDLWKGDIQKDEEEEGDNSDR